MALISNMTTSLTDAYSKTCQHELRKTRLMMIDGNLSLNSRTA